ncbi:major facilitator superfamily transporter [Microdochium trichocladiopsis]|uniref:Major facilitator superfamily transporter n=1 Tax=Microdochium trichocladiopsis TaxID=1682393 RepID=A0A9P8YCS2_9PEZI|nr:major facilitator superfamily transporter [Microdochium trichocladiopsis]KAH7035560.1 major facilitator superfamily transporter [Microdochium trichocladiopsis]
MTISKPSAGHDGSLITGVNSVRGNRNSMDQNESAPLLGAAAEEQPRPRTGSYPGSEDFDDLPWHRRPTVLWLVGPFLLFTLAFGGVIVPKLNLIVDLVCHQYYAERQATSPAAPFGEEPAKDLCHSAGVQKKVAQFTLILQVLTGLCSAISAPKLGALSDRYGRVRLLVVTSCGGILNEVITIMAAKFPNVVDYRWLILGAFFDGICGSFTAGSILTNAYASDCSPPSKRGVYIGYLQACLFGGLAFGPLIAAYFVKWTGSLLSIFYVTLGCHIIFATFIWFFVPESLSLKRQLLARDKHRADKEEAVRRYGSAWTPASLVETPESLSGHIDNAAAARSASLASSLWLPGWLALNPFAPLRALAPRGRENGKVRRNLILLTAIDAILLSTAFGAGTVIVLYTEFMFDWGTLEAGRFISATSMIRVLVLLGLVPALNYVFRVRPLRQRRLENNNIHVMETNAGADNLDLWMLRAALVSDCLGIFGYIISRRPEFFVLSGFVASIGGLGSATIQGAITKHVPSERVGALLGAIGLVHSLGRVTAPIVFNGLYAATVETFPQALFVLLLALFVLALFVSFFVRPFVHLKEDGYASVPSVLVDEDNHVTEYLSVAIAVEEQESETLPHIDR